MDLGTLAVSSLLKQFEKYRILIDNKTFGVDYNVYYPYRPPSLRKPVVRRIETTTLTIRKTATQPTRLPRDGNTVALKYIADTYNKTVRNDLADIFARLAIVETEIKKVAKRDNNKATEG
ncbi:hypothetical protein N7449_004961 [Penicillium cf. viridicatum]|uniref:Uncharacterized protein n=1 Tax=Penicillium cf. viridicatum TaxID=2972119 RepID=A0A9W9MKL5_9EURO|nr:hypothetical protein N7449_004961 [Penicillium cf. viridicatum]